MYATKFLTICYLRAPRLKRLPTNHEGMGLYPAYCWAFSPLFFTVTLSLSSVSLNASLKLVQHY